MGQLIVDLGYNLWIKNEWIKDKIDSYTTPHIVRTSPLQASNDITTTSILQIWYLIQWGIKQGCIFFMLMCSWGIKILLRHNFRKENQLPHHQWLKKYIKNYLGANKFTFGAQSHSRKCVGFLFIHTYTLLYITKSEQMGLSPPFSTLSHHSSSCIFMHLLLHTHPSSFPYKYLHKNYIEK